MRSKSKSKYNVIGEGSYGCVVRPSVPCSSNKKDVIENHDNPNEKGVRIGIDVSKIFEKKKDYNKELKLSHKVAAIDE